jgi:hypothetical protein
MPWMLPGQLPTDEFSQFLERISSCILTKISNMDYYEVNEFLDFLYLKIEKEINE